MTEELKKEFENMKLVDLNKMLEKLEDLKKNIQKNIVEVSEKDMTPERTSRGSKNR